MTRRTPPVPSRPAVPPFRFGYGTNGLADLRLDDALTLLADLGYDGVGLTLDHMHLDPLAPDLAARTRRVAHRLAALGLGVTVETGARYVLDPRRKHGPSPPSSTLTPTTAPAASTCCCGPSGSPPTSAPTPCTASAA
ncbi:hypothetical protein SFUMM280S_01682 [Streptomyces fumanus]